jgi:hypothetical protein
MNAAVTAQHLSAERTGFSLPGKTLRLTSCPARREARIPLPR